ncbi:serine/threonine-protein kinase [Streptomyces sp. NPDC090025]|uniref:serine/threonine-protein kinase n=1 Tax=Streptomyces sp. NPDC090025 TaxID=3365922 RepID=UPI00383586AC
MSGEKGKSGNASERGLGGVGMEPLAAGDPREIGPYRLLGRLGAGGMGRVYLARSAGGRTVAVKVVHTEHAQDPQFRARFRREIEAVRKVGEHYTAPVLDADPDAERPWVATGFVPGPSLEQVVRDHGPLPTDSVLTLALGLLRALQGIHGAGILHRDLKPSNVMLTVEGPRVIDFGIARALEPSVESLLTSTGMVVGSPGFMAPEQVRGESLGPAADVFALGCVLMYAATGRLPFGHGASNQHAIMFQIVEAEPALDLVESPELRAFLARCLVKDPAERPGIAALLADPALPGEESGRGAAAAGAWLPPELVARLARQAARLLDVEALKEELEREATQAAPGTATATGTGTGTAGTPAATDTGTVGLLPQGPQGPQGAPGGAAGPGTVPGAQPRGSSRVSRVWAVVAAVFVVLGVSGTVVKLIDNDAHQSDLGGAPSASTPPTTTGTTGTPGTGTPGTTGSPGSSAPPAATTTGPAAQPPATAANGGAGGGGGAGGLPASGGGTGTGPGTGSGSGSGSGSSTGSGSGTSQGTGTGSASGGGTGTTRPPATTPPKPPAKTTPPSGGGSSNKVPSAFVGTWKYTAQFNIDQPTTVYIYRVAPGQIAAKMITDSQSSIHCEYVATFVSLSDGGKRLNLGSGIVDQARSATFCQDTDPTYFALATPTGLRHYVGPSHGEGYHYERG